MKNTAGERSGCKTKHCWGSESPSKSCPESPTLSKLTHRIISCRAALIEKWCRPDYFLWRPKAGRLRPSVTHSRGLGSVGWCSKGCTRTPTLAGWCSRCCVDGLVLGWCCPRILDGVVFQTLGWCSKKLSQNTRWGGVPKVGVVFQKVVQKWGGYPKVGVVFQNVVPESSMGWCSKSWSCVPKSCPRIPTLYTL